MQVTSANPVTTAAPTKSPSKTAQSDTTPALGQDQVAIAKPPSKLKAVAAGLLGTAGTTALAAAVTRVVVSQGNREAGAMIALPAYSLVGGLVGGIAGGLAARTSPTLEGSVTRGLVAGAITAGVIAVGLGPFMKRYTVPIALGALTGGIMAGAAEHALNK